MFFRVKRTEKEDSIRFQVVKYLPQGKEGRTSIKINERWQEAKTLIEEQNKEIAAQKQRLERQHLRMQQKSAKIIQKIYRGFHVRANPSKYQTKPGLANCEQGTFITRRIHKSSTMQEGAPVSIGKE